VQAQALKPSQCGYLTFIPILKEACGTLTISPASPQGCLGPDESTGNFCVTQLANPKPMNKNGYAFLQGTFVFVFVDCNTLIPLPADQQSDAYKMPNVAISDTAMAAYKSYWTGNHIQLPAPECVWNPTFVPALKDCVEAVAGLRDLVDERATLPTQTSGETYNIITAGTCTIEVNYVSNWGDDCTFQVPWVMWAAQEVLDGCAANDGSIVGGIQQMQMGGDCQAGVALFHS
jgi:hypothetical protein